MSGVVEVSNEVAAFPTFGPAEHWYAIATKPRHEKRVAAELQERGFHAYVPVVREVHKWSDRRKTVEVPLFSCYAFVKVTATPEQRVRVLRVNGVLQFVGTTNQGTPIPDSEIEQLRIVVDNDMPITQWGYLKVGQKVRVRGGALDGIEGILTECGGDRRLVLSIGAIQRSLSVDLRGYNVEPA